MACNPIYFEKVDKEMACNPLYCGKVDIEERADANEGPQYEEIGKFARSGFSKPHDVFQH